MERRIEEETSLMEKREEIAKRRREALVRRTKEAAKRNEAMEERVAVRPRVKSLNTTPEPPAQPQNGDPAVLTRTPSFQLTKEGAILSQLSEGKVEPTQRVVNTLFHRINISPLSSPVHAPPVFSPTPSSPVSSSSEMRVVLLGRSGSGKSAAGNLILGREEFVSRPDSPTSITQECQKRKALVAGRLVAMVDTPDWFESDNPPELIRSQLSSCVALSAPGPHAFLLCVPVDQPAYAERRALEALEKVFGPGAIRNRTLVLFTYADRLRRSGKTTGGGVEGVEKYICSQRKDLLELVELCGDRYHVMDRGGRAGAAQGRRSVEELLEKVEQTVREGGGGCHTCTLFQETEDRVRARQKEIMMERRGGDRAAAPRYSSMQPLKEAEEEEALESTREEAERSVSAGDLENLPPLSSTAQASFMSSVWDTVGKTGAETLRNLPSLSSLMPSSSVPSSDEVGNNPSSAPPSSFLRSVWEMVGAVACRIPKLTAGGALLGGVLGVFLGGPTGGAIGATAGSVATEVGRWRFNKNVNPPAEEGLTVGLQEKMDKLLKTE
ncbi:hypothetical protein UPYG_G00063980 [Umbra pygmaea]|uniref:AIG1-type G domain-containing protein n=1 Tax=Umbra pygmaea TaxID=75934 RepID=A0ABD0XPU3_UMBPY